MTCVNWVSCSSILSKTGLVVVNETLGDIRDDVVVGKLLVKIAEDNILVVNIAVELMDPTLVEFKTFGVDELKNPLVVVVFKNTGIDELKNLLVDVVFKNTEVVKLGRDELGPKLEVLFVTIGRAVVPAEDVPISKK
jgi:hypothetical protein